MSTEPEPRNVVATKRFDKDAKRVRKRGNDMARLLAVVDALRNRRPLTDRHRDHALSGDWQGWRDCHIEPDWLLIYRVDDEAGELILGRTGTHSDLF
jgi:mRNA interferase YafQ